MNIGKLIASIGRVILGTKVVGWFKNELDKALQQSVDAVAKKYGDKAVALVQDAETALEGGVSLSDSAKLFKVATDLVSAIAADGPTVPFGVAVIVAQRAYEQVRKDALTDIHILLATI